jgi:hypothetical protein
MATLYILWLLIDVEREVEECHSALRPGCSAAFSLVENDEEHLAIIAEVHTISIQHNT